MNMLTKQSRALALAFALVCSLATNAGAQVPARYEGVIGSWACASPTSSGFMTVTTTYRPDGSFVSLGTNDDRANNRALYFVIVGEGRWNIEGDNLVETGSSFELIWGRLDGQPIIPGSDLWNGMNGAMQRMIGQRNVRTITALNADSLTVASGSDSLTCPRP